MSPEDNGIQIDTIGDFVDMCKMGAYTDDDGCAYLGSATKESGVEISISSMLAGQYDHKYTHIWWYNK